MSNTDCLTLGHEDIAELITGVFMYLLIIDICSDSGGAGSAK